MEKTQDLKLKPDYPVVVIGAGFSGLGMGIKLQQAGINDYLIVEASNDVGGTWRDSKYPGAAVDVPTHLYSYSFEPYTKWKRMFATSDEIEAYIKEVTEKHGLRKKIKFNTKVVKAEFDEEAGIWHVFTASGDEITARVVVGALGPFAQHHIPEIPGLEEFKGIQVHTAKWQKGLDLSGKRVAAVGSGASAIQVVPALAPIVKEMKVFQRRPSWIIPKRDYEFSELEQKLYQTFPFIQEMRRKILFGMTEIFATAIVWDTPVTTWLEGVARDHIKKYIKDPDLQKKVTPDYRLGQTRVLISNDWYPALTRPNVELVPHGVEKLTEKGVIANGKEYEVDAIVWATGYKSPSQGFPFSLKNKEGVELAELWKNGASGYKGVSIAGFPNLFTLMGPNTGPGHTSVLVYVEAQQDYIVQAIQAMQKKNLKSVDVKPEKQEEYNRFLDRRMKMTTWGNGGDSWYYTKDGRNTTLFPGFATEYVNSVSSFKLNDYIAKPMLQVVSGKSRKLQKAV